MPSEPSNANTPSLVEPCDRSACGKDDIYVCVSQPDDLFRACAEHAEGYDRVTIEEYRRG